VTHGDHFLQIIRNLSQGLDLSLDGAADLQTAGTKEVYSLPNPKKNLTPAKVEAWKMWHDDGLSIQKIAVCLI
jgi:ATP-dependent DNA helicase RecQ